jgi:uncharacterized membrane protein YkoI
MRVLLAALLALIVTLGLVSPAAADDDHERARRAVEAGEAMPLTRILERVEADFAGQLLEVELEKDDGRWVYEIELLTPQGNVIELTYDARSGALLETEGRGVAAARKDPGKAP